MTFYKTIRGFGKMEMERGKQAERICGGIGAVLIAGLLFLFNPAQLYFSNINDFDAPIIIALPLMITLFIVFAVLLLAVQRLSRHQYVTAVLAAICFMFWLQSNVFLWDYGVLDGTQPDWSKFRLHGGIEILVWLAAVGLALWRPAATVQIGARVLPALLVLQVVTTTMTAVGSPPAPDFHRYTMIDDHKYDLSRGRNVLVVVLDAFQADVFGELLAKEPQLRESLDGFTWYRNTTAGFAKTYPSVTLFYTGRYYENDRPLREFMAEAFLTDSVPLRLKRAGWDVGMYPYVAQTVYFDESLAQNFLPKTPSTSSLQVFADLVDPAIFRMTPHVLKPYVLNNYEWLLSGLIGTAVADGRDQDGAESTLETHSADREIARSNHPHHDVRFVEEFAANALPVIDVPVFRYYHMRAPHAPFVLNHQLEMALLDSNRADFVEYSRAAIAMVERVISKLKALRSYDDTALVVVSDHGGGKYHPGIASEYAGRDVSTRDENSISAEEQASGMSLMLIKSFEERGALRVSDSPVSNADLAATLDRITLNAGGFPGMPVQDVAEDSQRERRYFFYRFESWRPSYLPKLTEYRIKGFSWDSSSWRATGETLMPKEEYVEPEAPKSFPMPLGKEVLTKYRSPGMAIIGSGWSEAENDFVWSDSHEASLRLRFAEKLYGQIFVSLRLNPYRGGGRLPPPTIIIRNGKTELLRTVMSSYGTLRAQVPLDPLGQDKVELTLELPDAVSPRDALIGVDPRMLGVAIYGLRVDYSTPAERVSDLTFSKEGNGHAYLTKGWSVPESWATWTTGTDAVLSLPLAPELRGQDVDVGLVLRPYLGNGRIPEQRVRVYVNGQHAADWEFSATAEPRISLDATQTRTDRIDIQFVLPDAVTPAKIEGGTDTRQLGIALHSLTITARD